MSTKTSANIDAFEIQPEIAKLAEESVQYNDLSSQIKIYNNDILVFKKILRIKINLLLSLKHLSRQSCFVFLRQLFSLCSPGCPGTCFVD